MDKETLKTAEKYLQDAIKYWEIRRIVYNIALAAIVCIHFYNGLPRNWERMSFNSLLGLFIFAVLANVAFCTAYIPDIFLQLSGMGSKQKYFRQIIFIVGLVFAAIITNFVSMSLVGF